MIVCLCKNITEKQIVKIIEENACKSVGDVSICCQAGTKCGKCVTQIKTLLNEILKIEE